MFKIEGYTRNRYLDLSVEALWLARVVQDGLDILLANNSMGHLLDADRTKVLSLSRDVFERLGAYGCSANHVSPSDNAWTAASRTELIRQVAVHWRAFIDSSFGMTCASELIRSLTDHEISVLKRIQKIEREMKTNREGVAFCMNQELNAMIQRQNFSRSQRWVPASGQI